MDQGQDQTTSDEGVEYIWQAMTARYGSKWSGQWTTEDQIVTAKRVWAIDVGKTSRKAVEKAFYKMKDTHPMWPPTSAEFGLLCRGEFESAMGIPDFELVYEQLMMEAYGEDSNMIFWGIIKLANERTPISEMRKWSKKNSMPAVRKLYDQCRKAMVFGTRYEPPKWIREKIEKNALALEQTISKGESDTALKQNNKEVGLRCLAALRERFSRESDQ